MHSKSFAITAPRRLVEQTRKVQLRKDEVLLEPLLTGICSADLRYYTGERPAEVLKRAYPLVPLHECIASDAKTGELVIPIPNIPCYVHDLRHPPRSRACAACKPGGIGENYCERAKFCSSNADGFCQSVFAHPTACLIPLTSGVPLELAALTEFFSVATHAAEAAGLTQTLGMRTAVIGDGPLGFVQSLVSSELGIDHKNNFLIGIDDSKLVRAKGFATTINAASGSEEEPRGVDLAFECVGGKNHTAALNTAINMLRPGGTLVVLGLSDPPQPVYFRPIMKKHITILGVMRSCKPHFEKTLDMMRSSKFQKKACKLVSSIEKDVPTAFEKATHSNGKVLIDWR
ncbi:zinc-binding dehydrogenase [archaeon]|nr:zinc-binding dehydrogenase [archaeon]